MSHISVDARSREVAQINITSLSNLLLEDVLKGRHHYASSTPAMPVLLLGSICGDAFIELDKNAPEANIFQELFHPPLPVQLYSKA